MKVSDKYISTTDKTADPQSAKVTLSDDAYAVCEFLQELTDKMELARLTMGRNK